MKKHLLLTVSMAAVCVCILMLLSCQTPAGRSAGDVVDDATITTKVKAKIFDDPALEGLAISVETFEGEVTLTGAVETEADREKAGKLAKSVDGVKKVNNLLKIEKK